MKNVIEETVDSLAQAFQSYKSENEDRFKAMENKSSGGTNRPMIQSQSIQGIDISNEHKTAFMDYVRSGSQGQLNNLEAKSLNTLKDSEGGYLIPHVIADRIGSEIDVLSPLRRLASVMEISSSSLEILKSKDVAEVGWVSETQDRAETKAPELVKVNIAAHEMYAKPRATQKLLDDSVVNIESWITQAIAARMAQVETSAFINGDGVAKPKGILSYETTDQDSWVWGKLAHVTCAEITTDALLDLMAALKPVYLSQASWLMSRTALAEVRKLKAADGRYIWQPALDEKHPAQLFGYPVEIVDEIPAYSVGEASTPILFGNFKEGYQIVDRLGTRVLRDPFSAKPYVEFYTTKRIGGDVINFDAIKVLKCEALEE